MLYIWYYNPLHWPLNKDENIQRSKSTLTSQKSFFNLEIAEIAEEKLFSGNGGGLHISGSILMLAVPQMKKGSGQTSLDDVLILP